jgi:CDP-diacylglycerol--glycerol-3-phosphate 3-phosphatidyltransferase
MMSVANLVTASRIFLSLVVYILLLSDSLEHRFVFCLVIFLFASLTDFFDGRLARKNKVTNFGKVFDPAADKILVFSVLIAFLKLNLLRQEAILYVVLLLVREFLILSIRQMLAMNSVEIGSDVFGKLKTTIQMFSIYATMSSQVFYKFNSGLTILGSYLLCLSVLLAWISLVILIKNNKKELGF